LTSLDAFSPSMASSRSILRDRSAASFSMLLTAQPMITSVYLKSDLITNIQIIWIVFLFNFVGLNHFLLFHCIKLTHNTKIRGYFLISLFQSAKLATCFSVKNSNFEQGTHFLYDFITQTLSCDSSITPRLTNYLKYNTNMNYLNTLYIFYTLYVIQI
jgi:hypothetical protein